LSQINFLENDSTIYSFLEMASGSMVQNVLFLSNCLCHGISSVLEAYNDLSFFQGMDVTSHKEMIEAIISTRIFYDEDGLAKINDESKSKFLLDLVLVQAELYILYLEVKMKNPKKT